MPRKKVITESEGPYHVTSRSINREWFGIPMEVVWEVFSEQLYFAKFAFDLKIHSFVLMDNHYHMLISTPRLNLSEAMMYFHRETSRQLNREGNRINRTFAHRYFKSYLGSYHYYVNCYKYVYQNPIRANIVKNVEDYQYSTIRIKLGQRHGIVPFEEDMILFNGSLKATLNWLNCKPRQEDYESLRAGLKHGVFKLRKNLSNKKANRLEVERY